MPMGRPNMTARCRTVMHHHASVAVGGAPAEAVQAVSSNRWI
jgi:hypothetical protein